MRNELDLGVLKSFKLREVTNTSAMRRVLHDVWRLLRAHSAKEHPMSAWSAGLTPGNFLTTSRAGR